MPSTKQLAHAIDAALRDVKGMNITVIPVAKLTSLTDYMIICTATSERHAKALARRILDLAAELDLPAAIEGEQEGEWILVDLGDAVVHIMLQKIREYYHLEGLWFEE